MSETRVRVSRVIYRQALNDSIRLCETLLADCGCDPRCDGCTAVRLRLAGYRRARSALDDVP